jgi:leucyl aminopeptidase
MPVRLTVDHQPTVPDPAEGGGELVAIGVRAGRLAEDAAGVDEAVLAASGFEGKPAQTTFVATEAGPRLLVGLGDTPDPGGYRRIGAAVAKAAKASPSVVVDALVDLDGADRVRAAEGLAEGLALGSYSYTDYKPAASEVQLTRATVAGKGGKRVTDAVGRAGATAAAVALVRDLVNTPGGDLTPDAFAKRATALAGQHGLEVEVLDRKAIKAERLGGLLGVNRGSAVEPRFVKLTHTPEGRPRGKVALVGKGITFDAGGLSIKTSQGMEAMKTDMAGAAAVLGAMTLVPTLAPRVAVTAYLPLTDNMLGPDATRVGDVLRIRNDKTVEVLNTDAEGRLVLADALSLAVEDGADAIVDVATLTGACMVALGDRTAGLMSNHDGLAERVAAAAADTGEAVWRLPMPEHLRSTLDSEVADLRNIGTGPYGGASLAAIFLREFVGDVPWAHLDIAGPSNSSSAYDEVSKGGTGFGVRTLARLLATWSKL